MFGYIVVGFLLLVALGMVGGFGYLVRKSIIAMNWPVAQGVVLSSGLKATDRVKGVQLYSTSLRFEYLIGNQKFQGKNLDLLEWNNAGMIKEFKLRKYPPGKNVKVYYNPADFSEAILEPGLKLKYVWPFLCGLLFVVVVILGFIYGR
ncbi:MAG TPA: DUF3592 domain-containing protein [Bacteroidia bacterium]|jgi:hypothetical protein